MDIFNGHRFVTNDPEPSREMGLRYWIGCAALFVIALWMVWFLQFVITDAFHVPWDIGAAGSWGDTFGALNALFAALAFIGVVWTLALQREQLAEQRSEIVEQQSRQNASDRTQNVQRFERTFFELLHLLRQEREALFFRYSNDYVAAMAERNRSLSSDAQFGTKAVRAAVKEARYWLASERRLLKLIGEELTREKAAHVYVRRIHGRYESSLGPYFRLIYTILRNIRDDEWMTEDERLRYSRLLRSQLTSYEAGLIGINALASFSKDLSDLVIDFRTLKYASAGTKELLKEFYPRHAFLSRDHG